MKKISSSLDIEMKSGIQACIQRQHTVKLLNTQLLSFTPWEAFAITNGMEKIDCNNASNHDDSGKKK